MGGLQIVVKGLVVDSYGKGQLTPLIWRKRAARRWGEGGGREDGEKGQEN